ncbi:Ras protein-specific guanine nucleotide-releasing factor [Umbelopsis nana]
MVSSFGSDYHKEGSVRANVYGNHIISGSSLDTSHSSSFGSFSSNTQASAGMTAELLEDMSIIDDLYHEYGDNSEPDEIANESRHRERELLLYDMYQSEAQYIMDLVVARDAYINPLRKQIPAQTSHGLLSGRIVCTDQELRLLFNNLEQILELHREYLAKLEDRFRIWGPTQLISDVLRQLFPILKEYTPYMKAFPSAVVTYERLHKVQAFRKFTKTCQDESGHANRTLFQLIQAPLTRIPHYVSIAQLLVKYTDHLHPDYAMLMQCSQRLTLIAADVQNLVDDSVRAARVMDVYSSIQNPPSLVTLYRRLHYSGELFKLPSNGSNSSSSGMRQFYLFNDMLIWGRAKDSKGGPIQYKGVIDLINAKVRPVGPERTDRKFAFEVVTLESQSMMAVSVMSGSRPLNNVSGATAVAVYLMAANSQEEQQTWIREIQAVADTLHNQRQAKIDRANKPKSTTDMDSSTLSRTSTVSSGSTSGSDGFDLKGKPLMKKAIPKPRQNPSPGYYLPTTGQFSPRYV